MEMFKHFLADDQAFDMFITGRAGTGKTTLLAELVEYCIQNKIRYTVCAFTHKACGVVAENLAGKTSSPVHTRTLHSFLKKCPTINQEARSIKHIESNKIVGEADKVELMFVDEYSFIGEH